MFSKSHVCMMIFFDCLLHQLVRDMCLKSFIILDLPNSPLSLFFNLYILRLVIKLTFRIVIAPCDVDTFIIMKCPYLCLSDTFCISSYFFLILIFLHSYLMV